MATLAAMMPSVHATASAWRREVTVKANIWRNDRRMMR